MTANLVAAFTHLKDKPRPDFALTLLQRVASLVKPIMRKHSWKLPVLAEFYPSDPALQGLNVNAGQKICLRLRPARDPHSFIDEEQVVLVMLHELTHNAHGPHDQRFYKFLSGLEEEWDALKLSGYSGDGFHSMGSRVGLGISHNLPMHKARTKAVEAAERRASQQRLLGGPGRKLGGPGKDQRDVITKTPRELAAEAADRRARDETTCASGSKAASEAQKAAEGSFVTTAAELIEVAATQSEERFDDGIIDLTLDSDEDQLPAVSSSTATKSAINSVPQNRASSSSNKKEWKPIHTEPPTGSHPAINAPHSTSQRPPQLQNHLRDKDSIQQRLEPNGWSCPTCTLVNEPLHLQCLACASLRPANVSTGPTSPGSSGGRIAYGGHQVEGWMCLACGEEGMDHQFWSCRSCGWIKAES